MLSSFQDLVASGRPVHLAIGMFDGVHLGHQAVLGAARLAAAADGGISAVLTFDPHPSAVLRPAERTLMMQPLQMKLRRLAELGMGACVVHPFDQDFAALPAEGFLPWLKERLPNLDTVYVGENWRFGRGRGGDVAALVKQAKTLGLSVFSAPRVSHDGEPISSSRIRNYLQTGAIGSANRLLGYHYCAVGTVVQGRKLGRTLGFPTLNIPWHTEMTPRFGVYVVRIRRSGDAWLPGVANYGVKPTVGAEPLPSVEVHVLDPVCPLSTGDPVEVEFLHFLRDEQRFASLDELRAAIIADRDAALKWFGRL
jgi:riboflavin kinase/FMN adenylyltransferase